MMHINDRTLMKRWIWVLVLGFLGFAACSKYFHEVAAVYPPVGNPNDPATIDSLKPTLRWKPSSEQDARYDLIIYEVLKTGTIHPAGIGKVARKEVYYREGLSEPHHEVQQSLKPNTEYSWSVRVRRPEEISDWSRYDYSLLFAAWFNVSFQFKTPVR